MSTEPVRTHLPFSGVRVISFAQLGQGPAAAQMLADFGAEVVKVERPEVGSFERSWSGASAFRHGESFFFLALNRNKQSLTLDLKTPEGHEIAQRMIDEADVVIENYRPGVMDRLGLGYEVLQERNPRLIYCSSSGYGTVGPYRDVPGQDLLLQAFSGLASITGRTGDPPTPTGSPIVDFHAAALLAFGIATALFARDRTGRGQRVETSLLEAAFHLQHEPLFYQANGWDVADRSVEGLGSTFHPAPYGIYRCADGHLALSLSAPSKVGAVLGVAELDGFDDSRSFDDRELVKHAVQAAIAHRPVAEVLDTCLAADIWCTPVLNYRQVLAHPQVLASDLLEDWPHPEHGMVRHLRQPVRLSDVPAEAIPRTNPPALGADTEQILTSLGLDDAAIDDLRDRRVI